MIHWADEKEQRCNGSSNGFYKVIGVGGAVVKR